MKYQKKPVIIEAYQTKEEKTIHTLEGDMKAITSLPELMVSNTPANRTFLPKLMTV